MILLLILIIALITYAITRHLDDKRSGLVQEELRRDFQLHIEHKEKEHVEYINTLNNQFNRRIEDQVGRFTVKYNQLKDEYAKLVREGRKDAVKRSRQVVSGQVYEQISPLVPGFPYDLKDVRHVGNPLDFLVFDGLYNSDKELDIVFLEIKSGASSLNVNERKVRNAVQGGRVRYEVFYPDAKDLEEKLEASIAPPATLNSGEMIVPQPEYEHHGQSETFTCGHCKKPFKRNITLGNKPLFCPKCRGTG